MLLLCEHTIGGRTLTGTYFETAFASFLAWRDWGFPDASVRNAFPQAALLSADGAFLLGVMAEHTANPGHIYFPSGTPDLNDVDGDQVDLKAGLLRELEEETGITAADVAVAADWTAVFDGPRIALIRIVRSTEPAVRLRERILGNIAASADPELADVRIVRSPADHDPRMTGYVTAYLDHFWRRQAPDTGVSGAPR